MVVINKLGTLVMCLYDCSNDYQGFPKNRIQTGCLMIFIGLSLIKLNSTDFFDVYLISPKANHPDSGMLGETPELCSNVRVLQISNKSLTHITTW